MASSGFSKREREAVQARAEELREQGRSGRKAADDLEAVLAAIAAMDDRDRAIAERFHAVVTRTAPHLRPRTWYGFPAYALDKKILCFLTSREKGEARYAVIGFNDAAALDDGPMWPTAYAIDRWTGEVEVAVEDLLRRAAPVPDDHG